MASPHPMPQPILQTAWLGQQWHHFEELDSTNRWLVARQGELEHGTVVTADSQTAGKGRQGRTWLTPRGTAIAVSLLLKHQWPVNRAPWLTMIAGVAAVQAIQTHYPSLPLGLKWPNDVVVRDERTGWRKLGGVLVEGQVKGQWLESAVVGLGLNINIPATELPAIHPPATSLLAETGQHTHRRPLLHHLLAHFEQLYDAAEKGESPQSLWQEMLLTIGQQVIVTTAEGKVLTQGLAVETTAEGHLRLQDDHGRWHTIPAGDVSLRIANVQPD
jgi:BirA family transcriptional regulator, biotin operon repressor / biotin---[acetyl-CoA-carboxylase] ligase